MKSTLTKTAAQAKRQPWNGSGILTDYFVTQLTGNKIGIIGLDARSDAAQRDVYWSPRIFKHVDATTAM